MKLTATHELPSIYYGGFTFFKIYVPSYFGLVTIRKTVGILYLRFYQRFYICVYFSPQITEYQSTNIDFTFS